MRLCCEQHCYSGVTQPQSGLCHKPFKPPNKKDVQGCLYHVYIFYPYCSCLFLSSASSVAGTCHAIMLHKALLTHVNLSKQRNASLTPSSNPAHRLKPLLFCNTVHMHLSSASMCMRPVLRGIMEVRQALRTYYMFEHNSGTAIFMLSSRLEGICAEEVAMEA